MTIKPISDWASSYEQMFATVTAAKLPTMWGDWVHKNTQGLAGSPPYSTTTATLNRAAFPPVSSPPAPTALPFCTLLASGWSAYISSAMWSPIKVPVPPPPFSVISSILPSPTGIARSQAALIQSLMAVFASPKPMKVAAMQISSAFYTATCSSGIMIMGLGLTGSPPPPVIIPASPII